MASIKQRPDGMYRARYRDPAGREHARHFRLKKDAQRWLDDQTAAIVTGQYASPRAGKITVQKYFDRWEESQIWADKTRENARQALSNSQLGPLPIGTVKPSQIQSWVKRENARGLAASTIELYLTYVTGMFKTAVRDRIIPTNPAEGIKPPRKQRKPAEEEMIIPTPAEIRALLDCDHQWRPVVLLGAFCGLRRGEIAGVNISDIDFLRRRLQVQRQAPDRIWDEPKPPKGDVTRYVYLPDELLREFSQLTPCEGGWLLPSSVPGRCPTIKQLDRWWSEKIRKPAAVRTELHLHSLRHYFASGLINRGADVVTVQRALGHAKPTITLEVYTHLWPTAEDRTRQATASIMAEVADSVRTKAV